MKHSRKWANISQVNGGALTMRKASSYFLSGSILIAVLISGTARAQETSELAQRAILTVVAEPAVTQLSQITDKT